MVVPGVPLATRRAIRPYKMALVGIMVAGICLYGGWQRGGTGAKQANLEGLAARRLEDTASADLTAVPKEKPPSDMVAALNVAGLVYMFLALSIVCDEFFVPALDIISETLKLSPDIAGATFMAAGGSAPEFFTSMVGAFSKPPSDVGIATIVGSAVFNVLFVIGACGLASPKTLQLTWYPLARDSTFYIVHLVLLCVWFYDNKIEWYESLIQFLMYVLYCVYMKYSERIERSINDRMEYSSLDADGDGFITKDEAKMDAEVSNRFGELDKDKDGRLSLQELRPMLRTRRQLRSKTSELLDEPDPDAPVSLFPPLDKGCKSMVYWFFSFPLLLVMVLTVPDCRREGCWRSLYPATFVLSICWVAVFSYYMVGFSEVVGAWSGIDYRILALTLIASGTSVPDLLTSVIVTLQGHGDMAISSSIGSNIFDVTVGLPIPWLLYSMINGGEAVEVNTTPATMAIQIGSLIAMLILVVVSIMCCKWVLSKQLGFTMLVLYVAFMAVTIWQILQEDAQA